MIRPHELEEYLPGPRSAPRRPEGGPYLCGYAYGRQDAPSGARRDGPLGRVGRARGGRGECGDGRRPPGAGGGVRTPRRCGGRARRDVPSRSPPAQGRASAERSPGALGQRASSARRRPRRGRPGRALGRQDPAPPGLDRAWLRAHHVRATTRYPAPATGSATTGAREPAAEGHRPPGAVAHRYPGRRRTRPQSPSGTTAAPPRAAPCSPSDTGCCSTAIGRGALRQPATGSLWPKGLRGRLVLRTDLKPEYDRSRRKGAVGPPHQEL